MDGDGVVALKDGVLKFGEADGDALFVAFGEIVAFEHAGDIDLAVEAKEIERLQIEMRRLEMEFTIAKSSYHNAATHLNTTKTPDSMSPQLPLPVCRSSNSSIDESPVPRATL